MVVFGEGGAEWSSLSNGNSYSYDGDGNRVSQVFINGSTSTGAMYFMGGAYEIDGTVSNGVFSQSGYRKYYSIAGMTIAMNDGTGLKYLLTDHLGSVVAVTDNTGAILSQQRYMPFGQTRIITGFSSIVQTDFAFTGQRNNSYIELTDFKARWLDPDLQRFISPDDIIPDPTNPQNLNRYTYGNNSPIVYNDPSGHCAICALLAIVITGAVAIGVGIDIMTTPPVTAYQSPPPSINQTQWLVNKLNKNADAPVTQALSDSWNSGNPIQMAGALKSWVSLVGTGAIWDYKVAERNGGYDSEKFGGGVILDGQRVDWAAPANINYGYMAAKIGLPEGIAVWGAGAAQIKDNCLSRLLSCNIGNSSTGFDNPTDDYWVKYGYFLERDTASKSGHLTTGDITSSLNDWETTNSALQNVPGVIHRE